MSYCHHGIVIMFRHFKSMCTLWYIYVYSMCNSDDSKVIICRYLCYSFTTYNSCRILLDSLFQTLPKLYVGIMITYPTSIDDSWQVNNATMLMYLAHYPWHYYIQERTLRSLSLRADGVRYMNMDYAVRYTKLAHIVESLILRQFVIERGQESSWLVG